MKRTKSSFRRSFHVFRKNTSASRSTEDSSFDFGIEDTYSSPAPTPIQNETVNVNTQVESQSSCSVISGSSASKSLNNTISNCSRYTSNVLVPIAHKHSSGSTQNASFGSGIKDTICPAPIQIETVNEQLEFALQPLNNTISNCFMYTSNTSTPFTQCSESTKDSRFDFGIRDTTPLARDGTSSKLEDQVLQKFWGRTAKFVYLYGDCPEEITEIGDEIEEIPPMIENVYTQVEAESSSSVIAASSSQSMNNTISNWFQNAARTPTTHKSLYTEYSNFDFEIRDTTSPPPIQIETVYTQVEPESQTSEIPASVSQSMNNTISNCYKTTSNNLTAHSSGFTKDYRFDFRITDTISPIQIETIDTQEVGSESSSSVVPASASQSTINTISNCSTNDENSELNAQSIAAAELAKEAKTKTILKQLSLHKPFLNIEVVIYILIKYKSRKEPIKVLIKDADNIFSLLILQEEDPEWMKRIRPGKFMELSNVLVMGKDTTSVNESLFTALLLLGSNQKYCYRLLYSNQLSKFQFIDKDKVAGIEYENPGAGVGDQDKEFEKEIIRLLKLQ